MTIHEGGGITRQGGITRRGGVTRQGGISWRGGITRREFLKWSAIASVPGGMFLSGCAVDPVTGKQQLMMMSRDQEIAVDKQQSPYQFSSDYGKIQDHDLNRYVSEVGNKMLPHVHRPDMPYNFQCVNATYINAYAFPGGSIAVTRGILLELENEAELAALLGHELGHVNARHTAEQVSKSTISSAIIGGLAILADTQASGLGQLTQQLGGLGQGLFLAKYSRDNEREADRLGHQYMVAGGYGSKGMVGLMEMLDSMNKEKPSSAAVLFSTHPMSDERLSAARERDQGEYAHTAKSPLQRERYMDRTAGLRRREKAIRQMQEGERYMAKDAFDKAEAAFKSAIRASKQDYTAHVLMAKCMLVQEKPKQALSYANAAKQLYPAEAQGHYLAGLANSGASKYAQAFRDFSKTDQLLPGNPQLTFYKGYSQDKMGQKQGAAGNYTTYLKMINYQSNKYSQYAYQRLKEWGYTN